MLGTASSSAILALQFAPEVRSEFISMVLFPIVAEVVWLFELPLGKGETWLAVAALVLLLAMLLVALTLPKESGMIARAAEIDRVGSLGRRFAPRLARDDSIGFLYCNRRENCSMSSLLRCSMICKRSHTHSVYYCIRTKSKEKDAMTYRQELKDVSFCDPMGC